MVRTRQRPHLFLKTKTDFMNKKQTLQAVMIAASLLAASHAQAAAGGNLNYNDGDLLLNFRESADDSGTDATIDLGNINSFLSAVEALPGHTAVLDAGPGYGTSSYTPQFSGANLITAVGNSVGNSDGTADNIGFSAAAENLSASGAAANTVWLTRVISAAELATGGAPNLQQGATAQNGTALAIQSIGQGAESATANPGVGAGTLFTGALNGALVADGNVNSYHTWAQAGSSPDVIDYGAFQNPSHPSAIEGTPANGTIYEALWEVPQSGNGADVYEGYFTFQQSGEVDFTSASGAVTIPPVSLIIAPNGANSVQVLWANVGNYQLQQNGNLAATAGWLPSTYTVTTSNGTNSVTVTPTVGSLFFRLANQ
jgi:hypothetical protein